MTQSWKSWNWKLWLLGLLVAAGVIATSGYHTLALDSITVQSLTDSGSTVQAASSLIDIRDRTDTTQSYQLGLASLISKSTANNPSSNRIYLQVKGQIVSPASTMNPGVKPGDTVQLSSTIRFDHAVILELYRLTNENDGEVEPIDTAKNVNSCDSSPPPLEFIDGKTLAHYTLNYSCSIVKGNSAS